MKILMDFVSSLSPKARSLESRRKVRRSLALAAALAVCSLSCQAGLPPSLYNLGSIPGDVGATINGPGLAAHAGTAMTGGCDVNGDGIPDLIIGAPPAGNGGNGAVYVIYGNAAGAPPPFSMNDADVAIIGENDGDGLGSAIACADVNGDGIDDILITAPGNSPGRAYLIYGGLSLPSSIALGTLTGAQGMRIPGLVANAGFGTAAAAGDVNGDGFADIVVTAPGARSSSSNTGQGFVIFGSSTLPASFDLSTLNGSNGFSISATDLMSGTPNGDSVAVGDLNGDGFGDVAIGARAAFPNNLSDAGTVFVVFGHSGAFAAEIQVSNLNGSSGFAIEAAHAGSFAGTSISFVSNFNGDGRQGLVIGAPATPSGSITGCGYVVFGAPMFASHFSLGSLDGTNGVKLESAVSSDATGSSVAGVPDLNGDGRGEVILGAPSADVGAGDAGGGFVVYGRLGRKNPWPAILELSSLNGATGFYMQGAAASDAAGTAVSGAGDQNRDGLHDLLISSPFADVNGSVNVGQVYLLFGNDLIFADSFDDAP